MTKHRVVYDRFTKPADRFRKGQLVYLSGYPGGYGKAFRITSVYNATPKGSTMPAVNNFADLRGEIGTMATAKKMPFSSLTHLNRVNCRRYGV